MNINTSVQTEFDNLNEQFSPEGEEYTGKTRYFIRLYGNKLVGLLNIFPVGIKIGEQAFAGELQDIKIPLKVETVIVTCFSTAGRKSKTFDMSK